MSYKYTRNVYNKDLPTVYNVGTGQYMNEIDVHDARGNVVPKLVDQLVRNRDIAYKNRYDIFITPERLQSAKRASYDFECNKKTTNLIEYADYNDSGFELSDWLVYGDPRQGGFMRKTMIGMRDNQRFDAVVKVVHPKLLMLFYCLLYAAVAGLLTCLIPLLTATNSIFLTFVLLGGIGICLAISFLWFTTFLFMDI